MLLLMSNTEDCEQLFLSVGKCYVVEALMEFFQMVDEKQEPAANGPHSAHAQDEEHQKKYITDTLDKFLNEYVFGNEDIPTTDGVWCYAVNILRSFLLLADMKDAVSTGNGEYLSLYLHLMKKGLKNGLTGIQKTF